LKSQGFIDLEVVRIVISILDSQKTNKNVASEIIRNKGIEIMEKLKLLYLYDEYVGTTLPKLLGDILLLGGTAACQEIELEATHLLKCNACNLAIARAKHSVFSLDLFQPFAQPPTTEKCLQRILAFLENYHEIESVQISCLDGIIVYSRSGK
jgi:hypothetical protein